MTINIKVDGRELTIYCQDANVIPPVKPVCALCSKPAEETRYVEVENVVRSRGTILTPQTNPRLYRRVVQVVKKMYRNGVSHCWDESCTSKVRLIA